VSNEIDYLISGHQKFRKDYFDGKKSLYESLVQKGQQPRYIVIACSDSRVDPSIIMNCQPGDLFVIRNVANLVPPCEMDSHYHGTSAALEFGICGLQIKHVIILGHSQCGGIMNLLERYQENQIPKQNSFLSKWMELAKPACDETLTHHQTLPLQEQADFCGKTSILHSLENLKTFSWVNERFKNGSLSLHAWYFDLSSGKILFFNHEKGQFEILDNAEEIK
jgi:carbonic anhydrase